METINTLIGIGIVVYIVYRLYNGFYTEPESQISQPRSNSFNASDYPEDAESQYNLATLYFKKQEFEKAKYWFEQSANKGDKDAQYQLGNLYLQGLGVQNNLKTAFYWYEKASNQEHAQSQHNLGLFYMQGEIVERDKDKALYWFKKAAENGYEPSKKIIATFG